MILVGSPAFLQFRVFSLIRDVAFADYDLAFYVNAFIIVVIQFGSGDSITDINEVELFQLTGVGCTSNHVVVGVRIVFGYPVFVYRYIQVEISPFFYFCIGMGKVLEIGSVVSSRFQSPFFEQICSVVYCPKETGITGQPSPAFGRD